MLIVSSNSILSTRILLDCSATSHIFIYCKYFTNYAKSLNEFVTVSRHNWVPIAGQRSIHFTTLLSNGCLSIILYGVLHISHLGTNLVSFGTLHCQRMSVRSLNNSLVLLKNGEKLFWASLTNLASALYHIQYASLAYNITYLAKSFGSIHLQYCHTRFLSGPLALLEPSTNSVLLSLCWSQSAMLPSYNSLCSCR